ncbi:MAG: ABC transporter ATP-binding protein, partial [Kurthia sp.]
IIGPNGCGKSTLLKSIARILIPQGGSISLDGKTIHNASTKEIAKQLAILPQSAEAPAGLTVRQLISYGRFPHQNAWGQLTKKDYDIIDEAIEQTGLSAFANQSIEALSGGQRQRAWIALALAQQTNILILDEPTTYLDLTYQLDVLQLLQDFNQKEGKTIVMVLHDLNHASRFSDYMIAMTDGSVIATGKPEEVMTPIHLRKIFKIEPFLTTCPFSQNPICLSYERMKKE